MSRRRSREARKLYRANGSHVYPRCLAANADSVKPRVITVEDTGMGQRAPYIPRADGAFRDWLENFGRVLSEFAEMYYQPAETVSAAVEIALRYSTAYATARAPLTRSPAYTRRKNEVRREAWSLARSISMRIKKDRRISNAAKVALGVIPDHRNQSRIPRPKTRSQLLVETGLRHRPGIHRIRYFDPHRPDRRAKPYGIVSVQLLIAYADHSLGCADMARRSTNIPTCVLRMGRHVMLLSHDAQYAGRVATCWARWATQRCLVGPWSDAVSMRVM